MHSFYIPKAFSTISSILEDNAELLLKMLDNMKDIYEGDDSPSTKLAKMTSKMSIMKFSSEENKQITIEHISANSKEHLQQIDLLKAELEEKQKTSFANLIESYNKSIDNKNFNLLGNQDIINFYVSNSMNAIYSNIKLAKRMNQIKNQLFSFFNKVCLVRDSGVNANQEMIFKILIQEFKTLDYVLIKIENDENKIMIFCGDQKKELEDALQYQNKIDLSPTNKIRGSFSQMSISKNVRKGSMSPVDKKKTASPKKEKDHKKLSIFNRFIKRDKDEKEPFLESPNRENDQEFEMNLIKDDSQKKLENDFYKLIIRNLAGQLEFYANMCNGRNYTWKTYLESFISYNSLIKYLDAQIDSGIKYIKLCLERPVS